MCYSLVWKAAGGRNLENLENLKKKYKYYIKYKLALYLRVWRAKSAQKSQGNWEN